MHRGGIADKAGNRYEARWLTHQLLGLLDGSIQSVTVEALGDDAQGFEFSIARGSCTEWHQCKRQTVTGTWSIASLDAAGVLAAFRTKSATEGARCVFVSSDPSPELKRLRDKLPATHSLDGFEASLSQKETQQWSVLKSRLGGDPAGALRFLHSTEFRTLPETDLAEVLRTQLAGWFKGDPDAIAALFRAWLEEEHNFNRPLNYDDLIAFVRSKRIAIKHYKLDSALPARIRDATSSYVHTYPPLGAGLYRIERAAVREVLSSLQAGAGVVLVTGAAGMGKSAIIAEVIEQLRTHGTLHLAFRVDQAGAVATIDELGTQTVGTADNPVVILEQLAANKCAVLIVDQADAVSEVSGRIVELRRVVLELIRKAARYSHVQLIFACRSFDLENDHAFREIAATEGNVRVEVGSFARSEIDPVLAKLGILHDASNARLMALLALPIGLTLAATLAQSGISDLRRVEHLSELYRQLLLARDREIQSEHRPGWSVYAPLTALAAAMSERQKLVAPAATLDPYASSMDLLQRTGLIVVRGQQIGFFHESLFDYLHARDFVQQRKPLIDFLLASEQTLFRRTQIRQILSFERELERARYPSDLAMILSDTRVRPHIRETVVRWLATIPDPTLAEWDLVARYATRGGLPVKAGPVIFERKPWFDLLHTHGVIDNWLTCDGNDLDWAMSFLRSVATLAPDTVAKLIDGFLERRPDRIRNVFGMLRFIDPKADSRPLADRLIAAFDRALPEDWESGRNDWDDYYGSWIKAAPEEAARIFGTQLRRWFCLNPDGHPFDQKYKKGGAPLHWLTKLAKASPLGFLENLLPYMRLTMARAVEGTERPANDRVWNWRRKDRTDVRSVDLLDVVRAALAQVAHVNPQAVMQLLRAMEPESYTTSLHLLLETVTANPESLRDLLVEQLGNPALFKAGWYRADAYSAGRAIAAAMPWLTESEREQTEAAIFAQRPEIDRARRALERDARDDGEPHTKPTTNGYATLCLNDSGKREWSVLQQIGARQLSPRAAKRLAELDRKFKGQTPEEPDGIRGGVVRSPIAGERTKFMNDKAWLSAIREFSRPRGEMRWRGDRLIGGASELSNELKERAKEAPERFLALLARFPAGTYEDFAWGITTGIAEAKPDTDMIERVLEIAEANPAARPDNRALIWMIRACVGPLGPRAEALLLAVATNDDDSTGIGDIDRSEHAKEPDWKRAFTFGSDLHGKAINSARGSALEILGDKFWHSKEMFLKYRLAINAIFGAPTASHVQWALSGLLMSALKHEGQQGIEWVLRTAHACPEALYSSEGRQILDWVADLDAQDFSQLIHFYLNNGDALARGFAALAVFQRCLVDPNLLSLAESLIETSAEYRCAAAAVAAANVESTRSKKICTRWLIQLFDDDDKFVRDEANDCFRQIDGSDIGSHVGLFEAYVASRYFDTDLSAFLHCLRHAPPGLDELILKLLEDTLKASAGLDRDPRAFELHDIGNLVLALYASNIEHPARRARALDLIDRLVERGLMEMRALEAI